MWTREKQIIIDIEGAKPESQKFEPNLLLYSPYYPQAYNELRLWQDKNSFFDIVSR